MALLVFAAPAAAQVTAAATETIVAPAPDASGRSLTITVHRPEGQGPFPLVVINHGSPPSAKARPSMNPAFGVISNWFLRRGYAAAIPIRRGYGSVGGTWDEGFGPCATPDFYGAGIETARDIEAALAALLALPYVRKQGVIVVGQSAGGWGTIALAARPQPAIAGLINFTGGRGGHTGPPPATNCNPDKLIADAGRFGRGARLPMVWIYTENDSFSDPAIASGMHRAFVGNGGTADLHMVPPFGDDGHELIRERAGLPLWAPIVDAFLMKLAGME